MVSKTSLRGQMRSIGQKFRIFGRAEAGELKNVIQPDERIIQCAYGYYHGGSGLLVATDKRLLLIDKRPFFLNLESIQYEQIRDIDFTPKMLQGILFIETGPKKLIFRSISDARLKNICTFINEKIENIEKPIFAALYSAPAVPSRPYLNPAWRPHHLTVLPRPRPSKFHKEPIGPITG